MTRTLRNRIAAAYRPASAKSMPTWKDSRGNDYRGTRPGGICRAVRDATVASSRCENYVSFKIILSGRSTLLCRRWCLNSSVYSLGSVCLVVSNTQIDSCWESRLRELAKEFAGKISVAWLRAFRVQALACCAVSDNLTVEL